MSALENKTMNPFETERPQIVHLEKDESHYEYCRMQMHEIERTHRRTFICNLVLCIVVCFLSIFQKYIAMFDMLSTPLGVSNVRRAGAILAGGIFQIIIAMIIIVLGYLAWANFHTLNIILAAWYAIVTIIGIGRLDYMSALVGIIGVVFYAFSIREMLHEGRLSEMEGYPEFQEKFDISKSDIVIQTLLAHQGERRTKSTLFTTDYSLRKKKKTSHYYKNGESVTNNFEEREAGKAGEELAAILKKQLKDVKDARQTRAAIAELEAVEAARARELSGVGLEELSAVTSLPEEKPAEAEQSAAEPEAEAGPDERTEAEAAAAAILAEAEAKAAAILAEAEAKAKQLAQEPEKPAEQTAPAAGKAPADNPQRKNGNPNRKKKKH